MAKKPGEKIPDLCRELGISQQAFYKWKAKFGGLEVFEAQKLRSLEDENRRLKQIVADALPYTSCYEAKGL